ncbi:MAG: sulfotransferase family 2 domain-containing protein [Microcystaceae cyanobacterium]
MSNQQKTVYFLHLRKTAGTSLAKAINSATTSPSLVSVDNWKDYFLSLYFSQQPSFDGKIIRTHSFYGIHLMNARHLISKKRYTYLTILRDPIERAISYYYYVKREREPRYKHPHADLANRLEIEDFYQKPGLKNEQTRIIAGIASKRLKTWKKGNSLLLAMAKSHLANQFAVVGITERFNETIDLINQTFNWKLPNDAPSKKVNQSRPKQDELSAETLNSLRESHQLDLELYQFAKQLFEKQLDRLN